MTELRLPGGIGRENGQVLVRRGLGIVRRLDALLIAAMTRWSLPLLRLALGVIFIWFGALKLVPGLSPAEALVRATMPGLPLMVPQPLLAIWEVAIGVGMLAGLFGGRLTRLTLLLLATQMIGAMAPIVVCPQRIFTIFPYGLTLEGQYVIKNLVLLAGAFAVGAQARRPKDAPDAL